MKSPNPTLESTMEHFESQGPEIYGPKRGWETITSDH